jgi:hypothetical protein
MEARERVKQVSPSAACHPSLYVDNCRLVSKT